MQRLAISALKKRTIRTSATLVILMGMMGPSAAQSISGQQGAYLLIQSGWAALAAGRYDAALETFESALEANPHDLEAMSGKARALASIGETRPALKLIQKISHANPEFLLEHAAIYLIDEQPERALEKVDQAREAAENQRYKPDAQPLGPEFDRRLAFMRGESLYALGGYYRALEEFRTARQLGSGTNALRAIGDAHAALGDYKKAEVAFNDAIVHRRHDGNAFRRRGDVRRKLGNIEGALKDYDEALLYIEPDVDLLAARAETLRAAGDIGGAVADLQRLLKVSDDKRAVLYHLASALIDADRPREAERHLASIGAWPEASVALMFQKGRARMALRDPANAAVFFREALKQRPGDPTLLYNRAVALLALGETEAGMDNLTRAAVRAQADPMIRGAIGRVKLARGEDREALAFYNAAVKARPEDPAARTQRAGAHLALGRPNAALADAREALRLDPDNLTAVMRVTQAELSLGHAQNALDMTPALTKSRSARAKGFLLRAKALTALGRPDDALAALEQAKNSDAKLDRISIAQGDALMVAGRTEEARRAYERSVALTEGAPATLAKRGQANYALGRYDLAEADFNDALKSFRGDQDLMLKRGLALRALDRCDEAVKDFDMLLVANPSNWEAEKARGYCRIESGSVLSGIGDVVGSWF